MAFAYDIIRLFRRLVRHGRLAVDMEDILYWAACFFASFTLLYYGNDGVIRFAAVFGAAIGMLLYIATAGRFFVNSCYFIIDKTIGALLRLLHRFLRALGRALTPMVRSVKKIFHKNIQFLRAKFGLTRAAFQNKIEVRRRKRARRRVKKGKGGTKDGRKKTAQKKAETKKNTGVSPRQE